MSGPPCHALRLGSLQTGRVSLSGLLRPEGEMFSLRLGDPSRERQGPQARPRHATAHKV